MKGVLNSSSSQKKVKMDSNGFKFDATIFDKVKHLTKNNVEYWSARELQKVLEYQKWDNFVKVIEKAKESCKNSKVNVSNHFADISKMVTIGLNSERHITDIALTRYACYLVVQNGDPSKEAIAAGQTYFAIQTRKQEKTDEIEKMDEDHKRMSIRNELREHNKSLAEAASFAGIKDTKDFAIFQNFGYRGLYGGMNATDIQQHKGLKKNEPILDHMGSTELAANLFRATQTDEKIRRERITNKQNANDAHYQVGKKVRQTIEELGGTMPENLPTPENDIKQLEKEEKRKLSKNT